MVEYLKFCVYRYAKNGARYLCLIGKTLCVFKLFTTKSYKVWTLCKYCFSVDRDIEDCNSEAMVESNSVDEPLLELKLAELASHDSSVMWVFPEMGK